MVPSIPFTGPRPNFHQMAFGLGLYMGGLIHGQGAGAMVLNQRNLRSQSFQRCVQFCKRFIIRRARPPSIATSRIFLFSRAQWALTKHEQGDIDKKLDDWTFCYWKDSAVGNVASMVERTWLNTTEQTSQKISWRIWQPWNQKSKTKKNFEAKDIMIRGPLLVFHTLVSGVQLIKSTWVQQVRFCAKRDQTFTQSPTHVA